MRKSPSLAFFLALLLLLHQPVSALNWQGTGDLNNDNLTLIWSFIHANLTNYGSATNGQLCTDLSNTLNAAWDPAWNVVVVMFLTSNPSVNDVVLYGYAFKNHWMWFNGYTDSRIPSTSYSFVIWKDYNCHTWNSVGAYAPAADYLSQITNDQYNVLLSITGSLREDKIVNDPWTVAKSFVDGFQGSSEFVVGDNHAFSIVFSQAYQGTVMNGRLCTYGTKYFYSNNEFSGPLLNSDGLLFGSAILFQTR